MAERPTFGSRLPTAVDLVGSVKTMISPIALTMIREGESIGDFLRKLIAARMYLDALRIMAYSLPTRYAIWWGVLCLEKSVNVDSLAERNRNALTAARNWVVEPTESNRLAAERAGQLGDLTSAPTVLARSASYVGVKLPQPKYSKPHNFPAKGVFSALWMSTATSTKTDDLFREFLKIGLDVSQAKRVWPGSPLENLRAKE